MCDKPQLYKIVFVDSFGRETVAETLFRENLSKEEAEKLWEELQDKWPVVTPQEYVLWRGMDDLVGE